jgi:hypothetical protein
MPAVALDGSSGTGTPLTVFEVAGAPAIVYQSSGSGALEYLRATDGTGRIWAPSTLRVQNQSGSDLSSGSVSDFGVVPTGTRASQSFSLSNPNFGSVPLLLGRVTIDGPEAAEFSLTLPQQSVMPGGLPPASSR